MLFFYVWTNLGPILVQLIVKHIKCPQCCKSRILEDLTTISIIGFVQLKQFKPKVVSTKLSVILFYSFWYCGDC